MLNQAVEAAVYLWWLVMMAALVAAVLMARENLAHRGAPMMVWLPVAQLLVVAALAAAVGIAWP